MRPSPPSAVDRGGMGKIVIDMARKQAPHLLVGVLYRQLGRFAHGEVESVDHAGPHVSSERPSRDAVECPDLESSFHVQCPHQTGKEHETLKGLSTRLLDVPARRKHYLWGVGSVEQFG